MAHSILKYSVEVDWVISEKEEMGIGESYLVIGVFGHCRGIDLVPYYFGEFLCP